MIESSALLYERAPLRLFELGCERLRHHGKAQVLWFDRGEWSVHDADVDHDGVYVALFATPEMLMELDQ